MNAKQKLFIAEYLKDSNASAAARRAGYSERTAGAIGHELLKKPEIAGAVKAAQAKAMTAGIVSLEEAMKIVSDIARGSKNEFARLQAVGVLERLGGWGTAQGGDVTLQVVYGDRGDAAPVVGQSVLPPDKPVVQQSVVAPDKPVVEQSVPPPAPAPKAPPRKLFSEPKPKPAAVRIYRSGPGIYTLGDN